MLIGKDIKNYLSYSLKRYAVADLKDKPLYNL